MYIYIIVLPNCLLKKVRKIRIFMENTFLKDTEKIYVLINTETSNPAAVITSETNEVCNCIKGIVIFRHITLFRVLTL